MSAILSADDLNDFINPGVACIKPVETLPHQQPDGSSNPYEVTTEDKINAANPPPAQISLTDCLACAGCVTSAEAVLVSLQSHNEVLDTLDKYRELRSPWLENGRSYDEATTIHERLFFASISPQSRASLAATYNVSERDAGNMIQQLLSGPHGLRSGGAFGSGFTWIVDTNVMREACLVASADEMQMALDTTDSGQKKPILTSVCPGWICYAEKTHPHVLPHLSKMKSPQALTGTLLKSILAKEFGIPPKEIWHLAVMPCFDKKLEASRGELTSHTWHGQKEDAVRDVDCVITARELLMLAETRGISFPRLPREPVPSEYAPSFPDSTINSFLFPRPQQRKRKRQDVEADRSSIGTSGGYLHHILQTQQASHPGSKIVLQRGRNNDVAEYTILASDGSQLFKAARYYGFRNIQNLVRRLKPRSASRMPGVKVRKFAVTDAGKDDEYAYVEVMACPGGCTNGGGQIKVGDVATLRQVGGTGIENGSWEQEVLPPQREWLGVVDEAYWSGGEGMSDSDRDEDGDVRMDEGIEDLRGEVIDGIDHRYIRDILTYWARITGVELESLIHTTYRVVESDVGKDRGAAGKDVERERVSALAVAKGGGW